VEVIAGKEYGLVLSTAVVDDGFVDTILLTVVGMVKGEAVDVETGTFTATMGLDFGGSAAGFGSATDFGSAAGFGPAPPLPIKTPSSILMPAFRPD